jgi:hypothetical protein
MPPQGGEDAATMPVAKEAAAPPARGGAAAQR